MTTEFQLIEAAKHLGVAPWDLADQPLYWLAQANIHRAVEQEVEEERHKREERKSKQRQRMRKK